MFLGEAIDFRVAVGSRVAVVAPASHAAHAGRRRDLRAINPEKCRVSPPIRTVGVIGAGRMGQPIIGHMARKGFAVLVHDIDEGKREAVAQLGAAWAESPVALARGRDAILVCVGYDRELRELMSVEGLLRDLPCGTIVAVLSTVHPRTVQELAEDGQGLRGACGRLHRVPRRPRGGRRYAAVVRCGGMQTSWSA